MCARLAGAGTLLDQRRLQCTVQLSHTSMTSMYRGGGLSSITRFQPNGMVTLLPALGLPVVVLALQVAQVAAQ